MESSKPRILIAASTYPPDAGGPAIHAQKQYEQSLENGLKAKVVALAFYRKWPKGIRHILFFLDLLINSLYFDVICAHDAGGTGLPALYVAKLLKKKFIVRIGGDLAWEREAENGNTTLSMMEWYKGSKYKNSPFFKTVNKVINRADAIVVPSPLLRNLYISFYGIRSEKIFVVPNPIPENLIRARDTKPYIVYASRLISYKNLDFILESLAKIFPSYPDIQFLIMGDGPEKQNLINKTKELNISDRVIFSGNIPNSEVIKNTSECFLGLAPALTEFNPNYILQCLSFGKPFLMSRENGLPFNVPEEFLFDPRSHEEFENKLKNILQPENYKKALDKVAALNFRMSWKDVFNENLRIISLAIKR